MAGILFCLLISFETYSLLIVVNVVAIQQDIWQHDA